MPHCRGTTGRPDESPYHTGLTTIRRSEPGRFRLGRTPGSASRHSPSFLQQEATKYGEQRQGLGNKASSLLSRGVDPVSEVQDKS
jgi:hypothetical protein